MSQSDERDRENRVLRERLSRLSEASLRINESLDFDTVLQGVLDSARSLALARYGVISLLDDSGGIQDFLSSGMTPEEARQLWDLPDGMRLFEYLGSISVPLRLRDLIGHIRSMGLPELRPPMAVGPVVSFLAAPVLHLGQRVGNIYLAEKEAGEEFTGEDEETLVMFASQEAMVIVNARRHRDEQRVRADLETLINTSPVGVVVLDARTGAPVSFNRAALRKRAAPSEAETPGRPGRRLRRTPGDRGRASGAVDRHRIRVAPPAFGQRGKVLTHDQLLQRVWSPERTHEPGLVRNVVKRLRRKLGDDAENPDYIFTEPRVGYRMAKAEGQEPEMA